MAQSLDTAGDFIERIRERVTDKDGDRYQDDEIMGYMNSVLRTISQQVAQLWPQYQLHKSFINKDTTDIVKDQAKYDLPTEFYEPIQSGIYVDGNEQDILSLSDYENEDKDGVIFMSDQIVISPTPDENVTDGLVIYYVRNPSVIDAVGDSVDYGDEFPDMIISLVSMHCLARNGDAPNFQAQVASEAKRLMRSHVAAINQPTDAKLGLDVTSNWY